MDNHGEIIITAPKDTATDILDAMCWTLCDRWETSVTWRQHKDYRKKGWTAENVVDHEPVSTYYPKQLYASYYRETYG